MSEIKRKRTKQESFDVPSYSDDIQRPVSSLVFLLPLVVIYEIGTYALAGNLPDAVSSRVIAFQLMHRFLALFGITIFYLPGLALIAILVACQLAAGGNWRVRRKTIGWMAVESFLLAIPLLILSRAAGDYASSIALAASQDGGTLWAGKLLLSIGAGIYEELLFRLMLISLLSIVLIDMAKVQEGPAVFIIIMVSASLFSLYHYLGDEQFAWSSFMLRAVAGVYLAGVFTLRGFGVTVGCHVVYDVMASALNAYCGVGES